MKWPHARELLLLSVNSMAFFVTTALYWRSDWRWQPFSFFHDDVVTFWSPVSIAAITTVGFVLLAALLSANGNIVRWVLTVLPVFAFVTFVWRVVTLVVVSRRWGWSQIDVTAAVCGFAFEAVLIASVSSLCFRRPIVSGRWRVAVAWLAAFLLLNVSGSGVPGVGF